MENGDSRNGSGLTPVGKPESDLVGRGGGVVINIDGIQDPPPESGTTDGMATVTSLVDEQDCGFFGKEGNVFVLLVGYKVLIEPRPDV